MIARERNSELTPLTAHHVRQIAVAAVCCEATVRRYLAGLPVRSTSSARIEQALAQAAEDRAASGVNDQRVAGSAQ